jgi:hypothetical protein
MAAKTGVEVEVPPPLLTEPLTKTGSDYQSISMISL